MGDVVHEVMEHEEVVDAGGRSKGQPKRGETIRKFPGEKK